MYQTRDQARRRLVRTLNHSQLPPEECARVEEIILRARDLDLTLFDDEDMRDLVARVSAGSVPAVHVQTSRGPAYLTSAQRDRLERALLTSRAPRDRHAQARVLIERGVASGSVRIDALSDEDLREVVEAMAEEVPAADLPRRREDPTPWPVRDKDRHKAPAYAPRPTMARALPSYRAGQGRR